MTGGTSVGNGVGVIVGVFVGGTGVGVAVGVFVGFRAVFTVIFTFCFGIVNVLTPDVIVPSDDGSHVTEVISYPFSSVRLMVTVEPSFTTPPFFILTPFAAALMIAPESHT